MALEPTPERVGIVPPIPFCGADPWTSGDRYDVTVIGLPTDLGAAGWSRSAAGGPHAFRNASRLFPCIRSEEGACIGWYDYTVGRPILENTRIADAGDLLLDRHAPLSSLEEVPSCISKVRANSSIVLVLGGDHSATYWTLQALPSGSVLLFVDAHEDATHILSEHPHSGNVISFLERSSALSAIIQYGLRGLVPNKRAQLAGRRRICRTRDEWMTTIHELRNRPMALSIDLDVLDPFVFPSVTAPSPVGLSYDGLLNIVTDACEAGAKIEHVELMEFAPTPGEAPSHAMALVQVALRLVDRCLSKL